MCCNWQWVNFYVVHVNLSDHQHLTFEVRKKGSVAMMMMMVLAFHNKHKTYHFPFPIIKTQLLKNKIRNTTRNSSTVRPTHSNILKYRHASKCTYVEIPSRQEEPPTGHQDKHHKTQVWRCVWGILTVLTTPADNCCRRLPLEELEMRADGRRWDL